MFITENNVVPLLVAALSLVGSIAAFYLSRQERENAKKLANSQSGDFASQSYARLVNSLETRIESLEDEVKTLREDNKVLRRMIRENGLNTKGDSK
jgi:TolA-binding protein